MPASLHPKPLSASRRSKHSMICPQCNTPFTERFWVVIDAKGDPELLERVKEGTIHQVTCPKGHLGEPDLGLLLYLADWDPPLLYSPAKRSTMAEDSVNAAGLARRLKRALGEAWDNEWLARVPSIPRDYLGMVLAEGKIGARKRLAQEFLLNPNDLSNIIWDFVETPTWKASFRYLQEHPELLTPQANYLWAQLREAAKVQGDERGLQLFDQHGDLLLRCRQVGAEQAYADKIEEVLAERAKPFADVLEAASEEQRVALLELAAATPDVATFEAAMRERPELAAFMAQVTPRLQGLVATLELVIEADTWAEAQAVLDAHPEVVSEQGEALLEQMVRAAQAAESEDTAQVLKEYLGLLHFCREVGVAKAFADAKLEDAPPEGADSTA